MQNRGCSWLLAFVPLPSLREIKTGGGSKQGSVGGGRMYIGCQRPGHAAEKTSGQGGGGCLREGKAEGILEIGRAHV